MTHIAQHVIAVKDHSQGAFAQGSEHIIHDRISPRCKCNIELVSIGRKKRFNGYQTCGRCGEVFTTPGEDVYYHATLFTSAEAMEREVYELLTQTV
jgi:hypothetical protein